MIRRRPMNVLTLLLLASLACNLPFTGEPTASAASGPDAGAVPGAPTPTPIPASEWVEIEPPPPAGLLDALSARVTSGDISYEESLVLGLQLLTGEADPEAVLPELPASLEGFGVIFDAQRYLEFGEDPATRTEIERLLRILAPPPEALLLYSSPEGSSLRAPGGLARPIAAEEDCATLYAEGFPPGSTAKCFLYKEATVGSTKIQVFYPITSLPSGFTIGYADAAMQAAIDSVKTYAALKVPGQATVMKNVQVVFTLLESKAGSAFAVVPTDPGQEPCQVILFPLAIAHNEANKSAAGGSSPGYALFQQTVAHEMFHCFQVWNFPKLSANASWGVHDWWGESTAEYFSNVVYPSINDEWRWIKTWSYNSGDTSLVHMSYENFGFFQYLANQIGNNGVLSLIHSLNTSAGKDEAGQEAQLAKFPNLQTLFDDYARAFMDGKITDTSGAPLPTSPAYVLPQYRLEVLGDDLFHLGAPPFTLMRYGLLFGSGQEYALQPVTTAGGGFDASRLRDVIGPWGDLPPEVKASCGFVKYYFLMTTTTAPASDVFNIELTVDAGDPIGCDQCLIGVWDIDIPSFAEYAEAPFVETPGLYQFDSAGGLWRYRFRADGTMTGEFDFFYVYEINQANAPFGADIEVVGELTIQGTGDGSYLSDGLSNLTFAVNNNGIGFHQRLTMNGDEIQDAPLDLTGGYGYSTGASAIYSCDDEAGELLLNFLPQANLPPILFNRVSKTP